MWVFVSSDQASFVKEAQEADVIRLIHVSFDTESIDFAQGIENLVLNPQPAAFSAVDLTRRVSEEQMRSARRKLAEAFA